MRLIARFAVDNYEHFEIIDIFDKKIDRQYIDKKNPATKSLSLKYPSAIWMERKIRDEFGIEFENAFDTRPLVKHERFPKHIYPLRKDFNKKNLDFSVFQPYKYEEIEGDNVFVVPVGPIHAGIIEPGHFQFSQAGEEILHLEIRHYYKYRGIEKMLENKKPHDSKKIIERISGNETIAYQIAYMDILAQSNEKEIPNSLKQKYYTLLELERIIHHLTDLGFIPNDAGFAPALAFMSKLAEESRRIMAKITSHRFGFGAIKERLEIDYKILIEFVDYLKKEVEFFENWIEDIASLWDRFNTTGKLSKEKAIKYGAVGVAARASGIKLDVRNTLFYKNFGFNIQLGEKGEVTDRFRIRIKEILNSIEMIKNFKTDKKESLILKEPIDGEYMSVVESSIGELFMYLKIKEGIIDRFYVRDPSHINWQAFHTTIYKDIIADFPLINKSFDLSYAGNDL